MRVHVDLYHTGYSLHWCLYGSLGIQDKMCIFDIQFFGSHAIGVSMGVWGDTGVTNRFVSPSRVKTFKCDAIAAHFTYSTVADCTRNKLVRVSCAHLARLHCGRICFSGSNVAVTYTLIVSLTLEAVGANAPTWAICFVALDKRAASCALTAHDTS